MVKKYRDGVELKEKRPCWDYRRVNDLIKGDAFPLPLPENMFDALQGSRVFSKLDLTKGFWQIPLDEASKAILAMSTPLGLMEPNNMPFRDEERTGHLPAGDAARVHGAAGQSRAGVH
jgi:hypothetical protein